MEKEFDEIIDQYVSEGSIYLDGYMNNEDETKDDEDGVIIAIVHKDLSWDLGKNYKGELTPQIQKAIFKAQLRQLHATI